MVTEKDLFNFVFFKETLEEGKLHQILENKLYQDAVKFYLSMKEFMEKEITFELKRKIASKISSYQLKNTFILFPFNEEKVIKKNIIRFAAASAKEDEEIIAKTFLDEGKNFLIRFIKGKSGSKIYVFSTKNNIIKNFEIVLHPKEYKFRMENNSEPIILASQEIPESVEIKFN
jgi:hypothetical protein